MDTCQSSTDDDTDLLGRLHKAVLLKDEQAIAAISYQLLCAGENFGDVLLKVTSFVEGSKGRFGATDFVTAQVTSRGTEKEHISNPDRQGQPRDLETTTDKPSFGVHASVRQGTRASPLKQSTLLKRSTTAAGFMLVTLGLVCGEFERDERRTEAQWIKVPSVVSSIDESVARVIGEAVSALEKNRAKTEPQVLTVRDPDQSVSMDEEFAGPGLLSVDTSGNALAKAGTTQIAIPNPSAGEGPIAIDRSVATQPPSPVDVKFNELKDSAPSSEVDVGSYIAHGDELFLSGDLTSARLFYRYAADQGNASAAMRMGGTYDPNILQRVNMSWISGDSAEAASWYDRARKLGAAEAEAFMAALGAQPGKHSQ